MNQRIKQLAFEAANGMLSYDGEGEWHLSQKEVEKFAELIIKECADVAGCNGHVSGFSLGDLIKQHFGVEE